MVLEKLDVPSFVTSFVLILCLVVLRRHSLEPPLFKSTSDSSVRLVKTPYTRKAGNTSEREYKPIRAEPAQVGSEVQKCIGEQEREFTYEPRARPDPHVLSMSWRACPFHFLGLFHLFWGHTIYGSCHKQMRRKITVENLVWQMFL